jgi:arylsulfatase A-like enzyme
MLDLLIGKSDSDWRKSFLFEYYRDSEWPHAGPNQVAVRTMEFKLVESFIENDIDELYDLVNDPGEMNNLINESRFDEKEHELRLESLRLQKKYKYNPDRDWHLRTIVKNRKFNN